VAAAFYWRTRSIQHQKLALEKQVELRTAELQHEIEQRQKAEQALADSAAAAAWLQSGHASRATCTML